MEEGETGEASCATPTPRARLFCVSSDGTLRLISPRRCPLQLFRRVNRLADVESLLSRQARTLAQHRPPSFGITRRFPLSSSPSRLVCSVF